MTEIQFPEMWQRHLSDEDCRRGFWPRVRAHNVAGWRENSKIHTVNHDGPQITTREFWQRQSQRYKPTHSSFSLNSGAYDASPGVQVPTRLAPSKPRMSIILNPRMWVILWISEFIVESTWVVLTSPDALDLGCSRKKGRNSCEACARLAGRVIGQL